MKLSKEERETICRISDADDNWDIETRSPKWMRKLDSITEPVEVLSDDDGIYAKRYELPENQLKPRKKYKLSDFEKSIRTERLVNRINSEVKNLPKILKEMGIK